MIPTALYDAYTTALTENDRQARAALSAIIATLDPADVDGIRDALLEAYPALVRLYGTRAAQVALEFYTDLRKEQGVKLPFYAFIPTDDFDEDYAESIADVRREVGGLYSGKSNIDSFAARMKELATKRTMSMSDSTLHALANADPAHPKVALVPHAGACAWCVLIGSRGFGSTKQAMEHIRHDGCRCTTVVDFDKKNPALEGYDPRELYDWYAPYSGNMDFMHDLAEEWGSMSAEEKAKYVKRTRAKDGEVKEHPGDWSTYVRNRTLQEMNADMGHTNGSIISKARYS